MSVEQLGVSADMPNHGQLRFGQVQKDNGTDNAYAHTLSGSLQLPTTMSIRAMHTKKSSLEDEGSSSVPALSSSTTDSSSDSDLSSADTIYTTNKSKNKVTGIWPAPSTDSSSNTDGSDTKKYPRISRAVELMRSSYDCVVIGSGYGGGVAASRMARAGQSVCLLELGKERWPGEYPSSTLDSFKDLHCSGDLAPSSLGGVDVSTGQPTGMYHLIFGQGQNAVVANGLGGTSLINANVFLRADPDTMAMKAWPKELRKENALDEYYDRVESVLEPEAYPDDWPTLPKLELLKKQASALQMEDKFSKVKQTTRFRNGPNSCGVEMTASSLTGQDCTGLNDGSKTTTLVTYLADAWNWGAEMFCECEVRYVEKVTDERGGYRVYFAWHGRNRGRFKADMYSDLMWVYARDAVFLGAGSLGTTEILLRSKAMGLGLSDKVGQDMSGNGDMLAFGYNTDQTVDAMGREKPLPYRPIGPTITGVIDNRDGHKNPLDGYVIEEGAVPHALAGLLQTMIELMPGSVASKHTSVMERARESLASVGSQLLGPYFRDGAVERTQIYLVMSHDSNQAVLCLRDDKPVLEFLGVGRSEHVKHINGVLAKATEAVGGTLVGSPFSALMGQEITVHPIGGASMAPDGSGVSGATDHMGRLFAGNGSDVHDGLIVTDGAAIPTALGVNPLATIAALAERSVQQYATSRGLQIRTEKNGVLNLFGKPAHQADDYNNSHKAFSTAYEQAQEQEDADEEKQTKVADGIIRRAESEDASGFGFTEVMSGFLHSGDISGSMATDERQAYELGYRTGKSLCESARFFLTVQSFDTEEMVSSTGHEAMLTGTFVCPTLRGSPFMVQRGVFRLFAVDSRAPGTRNLTYDFDLHGTDGRTLHFHGYKVVDASVALAPLQFWRATTTLFVTVTKEEVVVAKGMMHIGAAEFASEVMTMTPTGSRLLQRLASTNSFLSYFARQSLGLLLGPLARLQYPKATVTGFSNDTTPTRVWTDIRASDGVHTRMCMWEPLAAYVPRGADGQAGVVHNLFMVPGAAVDQQIFATPTIPFNAVNYFNRAGYRVFVTVPRIGQVKEAEKGWTTYDARLDIRACLEHIRREYGGGKTGGDETGQPSPIYTIAHCMGSVALSTGLLDGTIPASWLLGLSCSQVFMNPIWATSNMAKARAGPVPMDRVYRLLAGPWFSCSTSTEDSLVQRTLNQALRLISASRRAETCSSASCHRVSLVFGRCWNHANMNEATHRQIDRFFGGVHMRMLQLLMRQGSQGHVMTNAPYFAILDTPANVARLRGLPIFLFVGSDNVVLSPLATETTYEVLCDTFGGDAAEAQYGRRVIPGYGHLDCWMGRQAWRDVYPVVRAEVDRVVHGDGYRFREPDATVCRFTRMMEAGEL
ncbi:glucose-methanol-choline oxidoreductase [Grosmannia clavigera kw1407]|uniref:Cholesterol oxidase n=1 Tax=Grosmannia clavigera (strain kw1407 / UAMH 11150) TaxID=655863 RepID=F0XA89_GROCL|nr:glucose-methanol-choline oxidoreductase [Grosmannia clavigera kw1407]EFX05792.1 glucose-methanol-choline oxidoreductase [Grosmannia clavigera kw1407]